MCFYFLFKWQREHEAACSRCRKEHRACKGGLPCRRCVALGSPECCGNDMLEQRKKQEGRSRQAKSHSITTPTTQQKPELRRQGQTCPQFEKAHPCSTPYSSSQPPQGSATHLRGKPQTLSQGNPVAHPSPLSSTIPLSAERPKKRKRASSKKEKHVSTMEKSANAFSEATPSTASAKTDTAGSTSSGSPGCAESATAAQLDGVLASLVEQVHRLSNMISCIQEDQNLMRMQVRSLQDGQYRIQLEAASISEELPHRLADQFATAYPGLESQRLSSVPLLNERIYAT